MLIRGSYISDGNPRLIPLISGCDRFVIKDLTNWGEAGDNLLLEGEWAKEMGPGTALVKRNTENTLAIKQSLSRAGVTWIDENTCHTPTVAVTEISQANPAVVTANNHNLQTGDVVRLIGVENMLFLCGIEFSITRVDGNTFKSLRVIFPAACCVKRI